MLFDRVSYGRAIVLVVAASAALLSCAPTGRLNTHSGTPEVRVSREWARQLPVAIAAYNMDNGRHLDEAKRDAIVTYDGVKTADGKIEVRSKTVYRIIDTGDSILVTSTRLMTDDLDDDDAEVALDQPSLEEQQAELNHIIARLAMQIAADTMPSPQMNASSSHTR